MRVLAIGSHPDDIELGCGGVLLRHQECGHHTAMLVMTHGDADPTEYNVRRTEQWDAALVIGAELYWGGFVDCEVPAGRRSIDAIEKVMALTEPDLVYTHAPDDSHQDHRTVAAAALSAAREQCRILLYPGPSTLRFEPTVFVDVRAQLPAKLAALRCHVSQRAGIDRTAQVATARHWGAQARINKAEAFVPVRFVWDPCASV